MRFIKNWWTLLWLAPKVLVVQPLWYVTDSIWLVYWPTSWENSARYSDALVQNIFKGHRKRRHCNNRIITADWVFSMERVSINQIELENKHVRTNFMCKMILQIFRRFLLMINDINTCLNLWKNKSLLIAGENFTRFGNNNASISLLRFILI